MNLKTGFVIYMVINHNVLCMIGMLIPLEPLVLV